MGKFADRGLTYTYTERRDVLGYECFVGVIINDGELFIKEAGEHCQRDVEPLRLGMKVTRQGRNFLFIQNLKRISDNSREEAEHLLPTITKRLLPVFYSHLLRTTAVFKAQRNRYCHVSHFKHQHSSICCRFEWRPQAGVIFTTAQQQSADHD